MKVRTGLVVLVLLMTACSGSSLDTTSTTTTPTAPASTTSTTSTTTSTSTTTTTEPGPVELQIWNIVRSPLRATPGLTFLHSHSIEPIEFTFREPGWVFDFVGESAIGYTKDSGDRLVGGALAFLSADATDILLEIEDHPDTRTVEDRGTTRLGTRDAATYDVESIDDGQCLGPALLDVPLDDGAVWQMILPGCAWNRVWLIDVGGGTLVAFIADVGLAADPPDPVPTVLAPIDDIADVIAELEAAITIGG